MQLEEVIKVAKVIADKRIRVGDAKRSSGHFLRGLRELGLDVPEVSGQVINLPPREVRYGDDVIGFTVEVHEFDLKVPNAVDSPHLGLPNMDIVFDSTGSAVISSAHFIEMNINFNGQQFHMYMRIAPKSSPPYHLTLFTQTTIDPSKPVLLASLPSYFTSVGFKYSLSHNPRDILYAIQRRIPVEVFDSDSTRGSRVFGKKTPQGIDAIVRLYLQNPNPQRHLKCYEVEIFSGENINPNLTTDAVPEAIWQREQNHYCMRNGGGFPFIPVKIDKISNLLMSISYQGVPSEIVSALLGNVPLSLYGTNQWFAGRSLGGGDLQLSYKPEWGSNAALVYHQDSKKRITPVQIHEVVAEMDTIRGALTERLTH